jgi:hypothetical protein
LAPFPLPAHPLPLSLTGGTELPVPFPLARAPLSLPLRSRPRLSAQLHVHPALSSLRHGTPLSAPPSSRTTVDPCARMSRTPATSPAQDTSSLLSPTHTSSLSPCPISPTLALSRAQSPPLELVGGKRSSCWPPRAPDAAPSLPECHPEVRNLSPCSGYPNFSLP